MGPLNLASLPRDALVLVDSAPIIYFFEGHPQLAPVFRPLFAAQAEGTIRLAVSTITVAEVLTGPIASGNESLAERYRNVLKAWHPIPVDIDIAERAARLRASLRMKLPDCIQAATAFSIDAAALVTHDRDFSRVQSLRILP